VTPDFALGLVLGFGLGFSWAACCGPCARFAVPGQGTCDIRQLRHTVPFLDELLVAAQQVAMDDAYSPGYHFMTPA
jgi:hypothetical protein